MSDVILLSTPIYVSTRPGIQQFVAASYVEGGGFYEIGNYNYRSLDDVVHDEIPAWR